jgi:hypothetical protein
MKPYKYLIVRPLCFREKNFKNFFQKIIAEPKRVHIFAPRY